MRREYRYGEDAREKLRRRSRRVMPILFIAIFILVALSQYWNGARIDGVLPLIPYAALIIIYFFVYARARRQSESVLDSLSFVLTDDEIMRQGSFPMSIRLSDIRKVEVDGKGDLHVQSASARLDIPSGLDGIDELRAELGRVVGGLAPSTGHAGNERLLTVFSVVGVLAFFSLFFFTAPAVVVPLAIVAVAWIVVAILHMRRVGGEGSLSRRQMVMIGGMGAVAILRALVALGVFH